jgi:hypothetical protein
MPLMVIIHVFLPMVRLDQAKVIPLLDMETTKELYPGLVKKYSDVLKKEIIIQRIIFSTKSHYL